MFNIVKSWSLQNTLIVTLIFVVMGSETISKPLTHTDTTALRYYVERAGQVDVAMETQPG